MKGKATTRSGSIISSMLDKRLRRTKSDVEDLKQAILDVVETEQSLTVRHLFYRMVSLGLIEKTETEYNNVVCRLAKLLRRDGLIPPGKIVDGTRLYRLARAYGSMQEAIEHWAASYRKDYWRSADQTVEVWCEKEAVSGYLDEVTRPLGVPLMVTRGFVSETVVQDVAEELKADGRPLTILFVADHDPSGDKIPNDVLRRIQFYAPKADVDVVRVAVTREQIDLYGLPTRPTKRGLNPHAKDFEGDSVEVDAMPPSVLREILRQEIEERMDQHRLGVLQAAEESEREYLWQVAMEAPSRDLPT